MSEEQGVERAMDCIGNGSCSGLEDADCGEILHAEVLRLRARPSPPPSSEMREALQYLYDNGRCVCHGEAHAKVYCVHCYIGGKLSTPSAEIAGAEREVIEAAKNWRKFGPEISHDFKKCGCEGEVGFNSPECASFNAFDDALSRLAALRGKP